MSATTLGGLAQSKKGRTVLSVAMALFATIEVIYEWAALWREVRARMGRWWDDVERREHEAAFRAGMRWMAAHFEHQQKVA